MLTQAAFLEMANTERFEAVADLLAGTDYEAVQRNMSLSDIENVLNINGNGKKTYFQQQADFIRHCYYFIKLESLVFLLCYLKAICLQSSAL